MIQVLLFLAAELVVVVFVVGVLVTAIRRERAARTYRKWDKRTIVGRPKDRS